MSLFDELNSELEEQALTNSDLAEGSLDEGCQTRIITALSHDVSQLFSTSLN